MNPGNERIEFEAMGRTWSLDGSHEVKAKAGNAPKEAMALLQSLISEKAGHHIPTRLILARALGGVIDYRIKKTVEADEPAGDVGEK